ncbi:Uncharacterised protein [Klebsiella pneumoniae]|nr:Uncharacterised protein [Klebsiella pneumoniae]
MLWHSESLTVMPHEMQPLDPVYLLSHFHLA